MCTPNKRLTAHARFYLAWRYEFYPDLAIKNNTWVWGPKWPTTSPTPTLTKLS